MDCSPPGSSVHGIPGKNIGVGCNFLLQGIFPTQGLNLCLFISPVLAGRFFIMWATKEDPWGTFLKTIAPKWLNQNPGMWPVRQFLFGKARPPEQPRWGRQSNSLRHARYYRWGPSRSGQFLKNCCWGQRCPTICLSISDTVLGSQAKSS